MNLRHRFSRVLERDEIYLANHSLGRPPDRMADDVREARERFRSLTGQLIGAPSADCVVPKTSAGQGLRAVLNALPGKPRVLTTRGEFDSIDLILKQYAALGHIEMHWVEPDIEGRFSVARVLEQLRPEIDLVVIS